MRYIGGHRDVQSYRFPQGKRWHTRTLNPSKTTVIVHRELHLLFMLMEKIYGSTYRTADRSGSYVRKDATPEDRKYYSSVIFHWVLLFIILNLNPVKVVQLPVVPALMCNYQPAKEDMPQLSFLQVKHGLHLLPAGPICNLSPMPTITLKDQAKWAVPAGRADVRESEEL